MTTTPTKDSRPQPTPDSPLHELVTPHHVLLPNRDAIHAAIDELLDDGASFHVKAVGQSATKHGLMASITVRDSRAKEILIIVNRRFRGGTDG